MTTNFNVATEADLNNALAAIDVGGASAGAGPFSITFTADITEGTDGGGLPLDLFAVNLVSGASLSIIGGSHTLNGNNSFRGLVVLAGTVSIANLTLANTVATGGAGGSGNWAGGGGAGLGGGLFVAGNQV